MHTDTCPVGVATQNPELREKFAGDPDHIVNFMMMMAEQTREILAELGFRSIDEAVGHVEALDTRKAITHWKAKVLTFRRFCTRWTFPTAPRCVTFAIKIMTSGQVSI